MNDLGRWAIGLGTLLALIGGILLLLGRFVNLGQLPGDISIDRPWLSFRFPIVTSIVVSFDSCTAPVGLRCRPARIL
jgi:hypothetical protein